jgi:4'-phosphopantetheinyl transferase
VAIWIFRVDEPEARIETLAGWLSPDEKSRAARFHRPEDRRRFVVCRGFLREIMGERLNVSPRNVAIRVGPQGQPSLEGGERPSRPAFNVAHSGQLGCIAVRDAGRVGIDIECARQLNNLDRMIEMVLSRRERRAWEEHPDPLRQALFFRYWTLKESLAKATGWGLHLPLSEIEFALEPAVGLIGLPAALADPGPFHVQELTVPDGYCGALAVDGAAPPVLEYRSLPESGRAATKAVLPHRARIDAEWQQTGG